MVLVVAVVSKLSDSLAVVINRPAVVKVKTLADKLAIMDARRWSMAGRKADMKMQTLGETLI